MSTPTEPPAKKRVGYGKHELRWIAVIAAIAASLALFGWVSQNLTDAAAPAAQSRTYEVVTTVGGGSLTYNTASGTTQADIGEATEAKPWVMDAPSSGFAYVSVQNDDEYGSVTCRIKEGDRVLAENTADANYGIATCEYAG